MFDKTVLAFSLLLAAGAPAGAELVYDTTHFSSLGAEITPTADGPTAALADLIVLGGAARRLTELRVDLYVLHSAEPFDLTLRLYSGSTSSGGAGAACGSGSGQLIAGSTLTRTITPPGLATPFAVSFGLGELDLANAGGTVAVALNSSRCDVYWVINEVPVVGGHPAGEPAASVVERCGSGNANNGALDFGVANDFGLRLEAELPAPEIPPDPDPPPELNGTMAVAGNPANYPAGGRVTYTVVLRNPTTVDQPDLPADEFTDLLPAQLTLISASASAGAVSTNPSARAVTWNGAVATMGAVTLTIEALIVPGTEEQTVANQGTIRSGAEGLETFGLTDDPATPAGADATLFTVAPPPELLGTMTVAGTPADFPAGGRVTYTVILRNPTQVDQPDNPADEFTDELPPQLTLLSASAPQGNVATHLDARSWTWNGTVPAMGEVTLTIEALIDLGTEGQTVINQGTIRSGTAGRETPGLTDDPTNPATAADPTTFLVLPAVIPPAARLAATKSVWALGPFKAGELVNYTIVIHNSGNAAQADNAGPELVDVLPPALELLDASSVGGNVEIDPATRTVTWNGRLAPEERATIQIEARIYDDDDLPRDSGCVQRISNQGTLCFDSDNDGSNDSCPKTDDPSLPGEADPTAFTLSCGPIPDVPALSPAGLLAMALLLAGAMWRRSR